MFFLFFNVNNIVNDLTYRWDSTSTTTPGQSEPGSNGNEEVLSTLLVFRSGASLSDADKCDT